MTNLLTVGAHFVGITPDVFFEIPPGLGNEARPGSLCRPSGFETEWLKKQLKKTLVWPKTVEIVSVFLDPISAYIYIYYIQLYTCIYI